MRPKPVPPRPPVVCLCGSTRFVEHFNYWRQRLTLAGKIVLSIEIVTSQTRAKDPQHSNPEQKAMLDELHLRKIDLADEVFVLNVGGYVGESTAREIAYARDHGKPTTWLRPARPMPSVVRRPASSLAAHPSAHPARPTRPMALEGVDQSGDVSRKLVHPPGGTP